MHGQKGLHHRHRNLVGLEGDNSPVSANDLVIRQQIYGTTVRHSITVG
jgi:hypothetical protein